MLGCFLARELRMKETVVPTVPGVLSALGGLIADLKNDFIKTLYVDLDGAGVAAMQREMEVLRGRAMAWLREEQGYDGPFTLTCSADMRYRGQSYEVEAVLDEAVLARGDVTAAAHALHDAHRAIYGHADTHAPIQVISIRLVVAGQTPKPKLPKIATGSGAPAPVREIDAWLDGAWHKAPLYRRSDLLAGQSFAGPAVVVQDDCTTCVPPGFTIRVDEYGHLRITEGTTP